MAHNRGTHQKERNNVEDENMPAAQPGALTADAVADAVYRAVRRCATHLRPDVLAAMQAAREDETQPRAQSVLDCRRAGCTAVPLSESSGERNFRYCSRYGYQYPSS